MTSLGLAARQLARRPVETGLNAVIMGLGVAMITLVLLAHDQFGERLARDARGIDLVVGAPGSPLQLTLAAVYHVDVPPGNMPLAAREHIARDAAVETVIPLALGDNYRGFRIAGTEPAYARHYGAEVTVGRLWQRSMEAVIGAEVARRTGLAPGDRFAAAHGLGAGGQDHGYAPYEVVGVFDDTGSVLDRLILTAVASVWDIHERDHVGSAERTHDGDGDSDHAHEHEHAQAAGSDPSAAPAPGGERRVTALLVRYASPIAASRVPEMIQRETPWQTAEPAFQSARLMSLIQPAVAGLRVFGALLVLASLLAVFAVLYQNLRERRYDLAVMRAIGARRVDVFRLTLIEGLLMVGLGLAVGLALGHGATAAAGAWLAEGRALGLTGRDWAPGQTALVLGVILAGTLTAALPAWLAARIEAASTLRRGR